MYENLGNEVDFFEQHVSELLKNVQGPSGLPIPFSSTLLQQLLPVFFDSSKLGHLDANDDLTGITTLRNDGYLSFYQSLSNYTVKQYNTLNTTFLERILLQAHSLLPMTKIALRLQLDNRRYSTQHDSCDRLTILLGMLLSHFGTHAVDSFLHPLFTAHIFSEKHPQQADQSKSVSVFRDLVQSRGGSFEVDYQDLQPTSAQNRPRWECSIKYQLARNTPFVLHQRNGQSKKQARLRAFYDIYNYYARNDASLVLHCSSSASSTSLSSHPHNQQHNNQVPEHAVETLSIPTEHLYQYDAAEHQHQQQSSSTILSVKRPHDNMVEDSRDMECNNDFDNINQISFLTHALLYDFSNLSFSDSPQSSPVSLDFPSSIATLKQQQQPLNDFTFTAPSCMPSPSSTTASSVKTELMNEEWLDQPMATKECGNKKQRTYQSEGDFSQQQQQTEYVLMDQQQQQSSLVLSNPLLHQQQPQPQQQTTAPPPQHSSLEELSIIATQLMGSLSEKLRQRVIGMAEQLSHQPGNTKGALINLAAKLNKGYYTTYMEHVQQVKSSTATTTNSSGNIDVPYYTATVKFGMPGLELVLTRNHSKKSDAETRAAFAIFELLATSSITITTTNDTTNNSSNNVHTPLVPLSEVV